MRGKPTVTPLIQGNGHSRTNGSFTELSEIMTTRIKLDLHATEDLSQMLEKLVSKMVMGLAKQHFFWHQVFYKITTQMQLHLFGIPAPWFSRLHHGAWPCRLSSVGAF